MIVSFGHNDMNKRRNKPPKNDYSTVDEYKAFLRGFAADARAKGANIAFATSIAHSSRALISTPGVPSKWRVSKDFPSPTSGKIRQAFSSCRLCRTCDRRLQISIRKKVSPIGLSTWSIVCDWMKRLCINAPVYVGRMRLAKVDVFFVQHSGFVAKKVDQK